MCQQIVDGLHYPSDILIVATRFNGDDTLSGGRHARRCGQRQRDARGESESLETGSSKNQRVVAAGFELAKSRVEIASNVDEASARHQPGQLRDSSDTARAEQRMLAESGNQFLDCRAVSIEVGLRVRRARRPFRIALRDMPSRRWEHHLC